MTRLTRVSFLLAFFFALDKVVAVLRQVIIARQFGFSHELDAFNAANNLPDLLFALISGGALAIAFIPVLADVLSKEGRAVAWGLFSRVANLAFLVTGVLAIIIALLADQLVRLRVGIAPGFGPDQQQLVAQLMRMNLAATLIFSISGLVMAGLQANQHFLLPAMAPLLYNLGQIFGALVLAPQTGYRLAGVQLPALGLGVHGLVYGVILGAALHLGIQIPGLLRYQFHWTPRIEWRNPLVQRVLALMGPRVVTMFLIQLTFIARDNLASRLEAGAISFLTYGYMIMQVPETLIGTAIGTALLPTLSGQAARAEQIPFAETVERAVRVLLAITLPVAVILSIGLKPLVQLAFGLTNIEANVMMWVVRGFLAGLMGQSVLEVAARSFYARQDARTPLFAAGINLAVYVILGLLLFRPFGAAGISLGDSLAFTSEAVLLLLLLNRRLVRPVTVGGTLLRALAAGALSGGVALGMLSLLGSRLHPALAAVAAMGLAALVALPFIWKELRMLLKL